VSSSRAVNEPAEFALAGQPTMAPRVRGPGNKSPGHAARDDASPRRPLRRPRHPIFDQAAPTRPSRATPSAWDRDVDPQPRRTGSSTSAPPRRQGRPPRALMRNEGSVTAGRAPRGPAGRQLTSDVARSTHDDLSASTRRRHRRRADGPSTASPQSPRRAAAWARSVRAPTCAGMRRPTAPIELQRASSTPPEGPVASHSFFFSVSRGLLHLHHSPPPGRELRTGRAFLDRHPDFVLVRHEVTLPRGRKPNGFYIATLRPC